MYTRLTPNAIACPIPNFGTFLAQRGLKWSVRHILPPLEKCRKEINIYVLLKEKIFFQREFTPLQTLTGRIGWQCGLYLLSHQSVCLSVSLFVSQSGDYFGNYSKVRSSGKVRVGSYLLSHWSVSLCPSASVATTLYFGTLQQDEINTEARVRDTHSSRYKGSSHTRSADSIVLSTHNLLPIDRIVISSLT